MSRIPVVIGVSGHRDLLPGDLPRLRTQTESELAKLMACCPNSPFVMLNSLAEGADQLAAEVGLSLGMELRCPLPLQLTEYRKDFSGEALARLDALLARASAVFTAPAREPVPEAANRSFFYRQAGAYVSYHSHVLLALWDGSVAKPGGCGTAEAVSFMLNGNAGEPDRAGMRAAGDGAVLHIPAARASGTHPGSDAPRLLCGDEAAFFHALSMTDTFNADAARVQADCPPLVTEATLAGANAELSALHNCYLTADALSSACKRRYLAYMKWLALFGIVLVLTFLLYDEMESNLFLPLYGVAMACSFLLARRAKKSESHRNYLEYRALAETLRVQFYLSLSGIAHLACEDFSWSQTCEIPWIKQALTALTALGHAEAPSCVDTESADRLWIAGQLAHHEEALARTNRHLVQNDRVTRAALILSVTVFFVILALEFGFASVMAGTLPLDTLRGALLMHPEQQLAVRGLFKILLGVSSAGTLFISNYYGRLSLSRKCSDHEKMRLLYAQAAQRCASAAPAERDALLRALAREEILENGNWLSYCRDNTPQLYL